MSIVVTVQRNEITRTVSSTGRRVFNISVQTSQPTITVSRSGTARGPAGENGLSAYELATANGFVGTISEWLASLEGQDGNPGVDGDQIKGFRDVAGTTDTLLASDAGYVVRYSSATDITVTVNTVHAGRDMITLVAEGAGNIILTAGAGFTMRWPDNDNTKNKSPGINKPIQLLFHSPTSATPIGTTS